MKKIVSTQGITDGLFFALTEAIRERVDDKLENLFRQTYGTDIRLSPMLSYELHNGEVTEIQLTYTVDNPTPQQLIWLCEACEDFYNLYGFMVDDIPDANSIYFCATDLFDMASLIHALDCQTVSLESVLCAVDAHLTERDAIYSPSGAHLIQIPNVEHYRIREGTLFVSPLAARHCNQLQRLEIPYGMLFDDHSLTEFSQELMVKQWTTHYDGTPVEEEEDLDDDMPIFDDHGVGLLEILRYHKRQFPAITNDFSDLRHVVFTGVFLDRAQYLPGYAYLMHFRLRVFRAASSPFRRQCSERE